MKKLFIACSVLLSLAASTSYAVSRQPNVLFIAIDDLRPELGCYGEPAIRSPHIDQLAENSVTFNRAYCQLAVCNPSRVSLLTGLRPDSTKVWDLPTRFRHTIPDAITLPQYFKQHGYTALGYGKIFHNPWPDNISWSEPHGWPQKSSLWSDAAKKRLADYKNEMRANGRREVEINRMRAQATEIVDVPDHEHVDGAIAQQALAAMRRLAKQPDKPFFLAAGFIRPHLPFVVPRVYWDLYDSEAIPPAANPALPTGAPRYAMNTMYELRDYMDFDQTVDPREGSLTLAQQRRLKHGYYASVSFIDAQVGLLMAELNKLGLADNTIVVLWGDHGWKLGEHNSWCKQSNYEIDTRVPLIIHAPGAKGNGATTDALVEFVDVYPTLCELAGIPTPSVLEGKSLTPILDNPTKTIKDAVFSQFLRRDGGTPLMGYAMRTERYRYVEWQDRRDQSIVARELYDHQKDPLETTNVANQHADLINTLNKQMWTALPTPPAYIPPPRKRPQAIFENVGVAPLTLYWIDADGNRKKQGVIAPGKQMLQNSTLGHRFQVQGPNGFSPIFEVTKQRQTFRITSQFRRTKQTEQEDVRPKFIPCMADDWSAPHAGILREEYPVYADLLQEVGYHIGPQEAYAMANQMEYFSEATGAFFGVNDFYPCTQTELNKHDPRIFNLIKQVWFE